jgi:hypothetical protein
MRPKNEFALLIRDATGKERDVWMWLSDAHAARCWGAYQDKTPMISGDVILGMVKAPLVWRKTP